MSNERNTPLLNLLRSNVQAKKYCYCVGSDWRFLKVSTNACFATGSPGAPHHICASDQIRAARGFAAKVCLIHHT